MRERVVSGGRSPGAFGINNNMRRFVLIGVAAGLLVMLALALHGCGEFRGERIQVRKRFDAMRQALRTGDTNAAVQMIVPEVRSAYQNDLQHFNTFVGSRSNEPGMWIWAGKVRVVPQRRFIWGIIPSGNAVEMIKTNGDWFFTGRVFID